ncbi:MAG TPA: DEAD/DEAH box helicase family protein [Bosea sp. (in: a-proteobacteria)]
MITLREDQEEVRTKLRVALRSSASVLAYAPTGFGKTVLASALIKMIHAAGKRVIFCVHRVDLIVQTAKTFEKFGIPFSYIAAGHHYNPYHRVFIASIATLRNRLGKHPADYVMVDEAHLSAAAGWAAVALHYKGTGSRLIGYTGSPERLDGKPLGDVWDTMVMGPSVRWLIDNGHLSKYRAFSPAGLDLSGVHVRNGEFVTSEIDEIMAGKAVLAGAVRHWRKFAGGKRTIAFAPSIVRSEQLAAEFRANGITAVALDGNTAGPDRRAAFIGFADRQIDLIVNVGLFCEGFDLAAQVDRDVTIEAVLDYSPSHSLARVLQKWGRGLRRKPDPAILLDLVGGFSRHGFPDDDREWSLAGRKKAEREVEAMTCSGCFASHAPAPKCPECGLVYPVKGRDAVGQGRLLDEVEGELEEVDVETMRREQRKSHDEMARKLARDVIAGREPDLPKTLQEQLKFLVKQATARGAKSPEKWAAHVITARQAKQRQGVGA